MEPFLNFTLGKQQVVFLILQYVCSSYVYFLIVLQKYFNHSFLSILHRRIAARANLVGMNGGIHNVQRAKVDIVKANILQSDNCKSTYS